MSLKEALASGKFVVTTEIGPPKGISLDKTIEAITPLKNRVDSVNVTDLQSSVMRMSSLAGCYILKAHGFDPVLQMTCRDRNRLALQSDLISAAALGVTNVLALTGDHPALGDHPQAKPVFDLDAVQLIEVIRTLETGVDMNGNKLQGAWPSFFVGAVVNPVADPLEPELIKMEKKIKAGAQFFQTQAIFDTEAFARFMAVVRSWNIPILAGIVVLKSEKSARYMNDHVPGVLVPDEIIHQMSSAVDKKTAGIDIAARMSGQLRDLCQGVHIMPIGAYDTVGPVLDAIGR